MGMSEDQQLLQEAGRRLRASTDLAAFNLYYGTLDGRVQYGIYLRVEELPDDFREWLTIQLSSTRDERQLQLVGV